MAVGHATLTTLSLEVFSPSGSVSVTLPPVSGSFRLGDASKSRWRPTTGSSSRSRTGHTQTGSRTRSRAAPPPSSTKGTPTGSTSRRSSRWRRLLPIPHPRTNDNTACSPSTSVSEFGGGRATSASGCILRSNVMVERWPTSACPPSGATRRAFAPLCHAVISLPHERGEIAWLAVRTRPTSASSRCPGDPSGAEGPGGSSRAHRDEPREAGGDDPLRSKDEPRGGGGRGPSASHGR